MQNTTQKLLLVLFIQFVFPTALLVAQKQDSESDRQAWKGKLETPAGELRLNILLESSDDGYEGQLISLDQNNAKIELSGIIIDDNEFSFQVPRINASFSGSYNRDRSEITGVFEQSGMKIPLKLSKLDKVDSADVAKTPKDNEQLVEAWIGELDMGAVQPVMQFRIVKNADGEKSARFDSITEGLKGFKATYSIQGGEISFDVERIKLTYRGTLNENKDMATGTWSQGGRTIDLVLKKETSEYADANVWENRPQRPREPLPYISEEVVIENATDKLTLAGTLTLPEGEGLFPVAVLISGSGPQDRDETLMGHKPFLVLADYLTRRGVAVLRYDDRGTGKSNGKYSAATIEDFATDTSAVVDFLKSHPKIDVEKIGLIGHSEGGVVAPMVCDLREDIAFVVLMATIGVDGGQISTSQAKHLIEASGLSEEDQTIRLQVNKIIIDAVKNAAPDQDVIAGVRKKVEIFMATLPDEKRQDLEQDIQTTIEIGSERLKSNWMRFFVSYDPQPAIKKIKCPVLALNGTKDTQVLIDLNFPPIEKALKEGGNQDFKMVRLEGLNHLFQACESGEMAEYATIQETINPKALKTIGDWIIERFTK